MTTSRRVPFFALVLLLTLAVSPLLGRQVTAQDAETYFVPETSQLIAEPFLSAWIDLGGPDRLGMPVSSVDAPGPDATQYFERGALRLGDDGAAAMLPVGSSLLDRPDPSEPDRTGRRSPSPRETRAFFALGQAPSGDAVLFDGTTGHAVKGSMRTAYNAAGGADTLGAPLSEAYQSGDARVQWFEMGRLEDRGAAVAGGPVGVELAILDGVDLGPRSQGTYALLNLTGPVLASGVDPTGGIAAAGTAGPSFAPARIAIPAIGVDAAIESIGIDGGVMGTPSNPWNVGWYSGLGGPGGNTVMAGHKDWASIGPVVFFSLGALGPGSEIYLYDGAGASATYVVYSAYTVDAYADSGGIINQGGDTLTLITCGGDFSGGMYNLRVIVHASRSA